MITQYHDLSKAHSVASTKLYVDKDIVRTIMYVTISLCEQLLSCVSSEHEVRNHISREITSSSKLLDETTPPAPVNVSPTKEKPIQEEVSLMCYSSEEAKALAPILQLI
ncbi:hypothetical protein TVAGG3_0217010 [Trichomonas vaginalis G3]|uniref:hypothetical protein n=1 Tax=Trichomonas vaginalis (strain ATCC PRA-98 / G3) TaxID=412133 RepID=UPI0021E5CBA1|nr:hypothetical protein TVAGG3_0217010 [Trichomonas vaginalis G3]KAI5551632.1 hypothetical protein TVAGG3_0217010 [Trichomonas vaginalis G3]